MGHYQRVEELGVVAERINIKIEGIKRQVDIVESRLYLDSQNGGKIYYN
jgi:hypothetical protein